MKYIIRNCKQVKVLAKCRNHHDRRGEVLTREWQHGVEVRGHVAVTDDEYNLLTVPEVSRSRLFSLIADFQAQKEKVYDMER